MTANGATQANGGNGHDADVMEVPVALGGLEAQTRGELDIQIVTARRFPRSVRTFIQHATELATLDEDTAASCFYALPRGRKTVEGPSARLAEIVAYSWGHMRVEGRVVNLDEAFVTSRGTAWDLERNVAIAYEVRRRITDKQGARYNDDMIMVTSNAATSIALRNAVFKVVPSPFWHPIYIAARKVAIGTQVTLANRRASMLEHFQKLGATNEQVFQKLGVGGVEDITLEHMGTLRGLATAIKDGDTSVEQAFAGEAVQAPQKKGANADESTPPAEPATEKADIATPEGASQTTESVEMPDAGSIFDQ